MRWRPQRSSVAKCLAPWPRVRTRPAICHKVRHCGTAQRSTQRRNTARPKKSLRLSLRADAFVVPVKDFLASPIQHAVEAARIIVDRLQIFYPVRLFAQIGMNCEREDFRALFSLRILPIELIDGAFGEIVRLVVL